MYCLNFIHMIILHSKFRTRWIIKVNLTFLKYLQRPVFFATMVLRSGRILYVLATDKKNSLMNQVQSMFDFVTMFPPRHFKS